MTWAYSPSYGKPLSVPQGVIGLMTRFGMNVVLAHPEGYHLIPETVELAGKLAAEGGGASRSCTPWKRPSTAPTSSIPRAGRRTPSWSSAPSCLKKNDTPGLKELEKECLASNAEFTDWECTEDKMKPTRGRQGLYLHCLPADISGVSCAAGEVAATVFDRYRIPTYVQAGFKPYVIAAVMLTSRFEEPLKVLKALQARGTRRAGL